MQTKGKTVQFRGKDMKLEGKILEKEFNKLNYFASIFPSNLTQAQVKEYFKKRSEEKRLEW